MVSIRSSPSRPASAGSTKSAKKNGPGRPTPEELERKKATIVRVATSSFIGEGYAGTSLVEMAKRAGCATRTIYEHFGGKEKLFEQVIFSRDNAAQVPVPAATHSDSLFDALMKVGNYAIQMSRDQKTVDMMRLMTAEQMRFPEMVNKVAAASFDRFFTNVERVFADLHLIGRIPEGNHLQSARFFVDLILGTVPLYNYTHWMELNSEADLSSKVDLFIAGRWGPNVARNSRKATAAHKRQLRSASGKSRT
jgi:TetR/AcrR family transcriptional repressor of mexJK operon